MAINTDLDRRLAALDAALAQGIREADAERVEPAEDVFARLEGKYKALAVKSPK
ncbi:hypothetical protein [Mesorhizobium sp. NZP2077]|uniref:hypothetical protein n=1 Tax=Mesorhizobium sp. NZP2077 TaxID=2483404 RepID=UPI001557E0F0|nr:hypothetical protein [Mesorhizobium sp. NZP2077]QKD15827.1 hypothetical protein HGP13_12375 [Mesorhizobium sp. NZP2077]